MLNDLIKEKIENGTVTVTSRKGKGLGVVIPGEYILTNAHHLDFSVEDSVTVGLFRLEDIDSHVGKFKAVPYFIEPVSNIAVLGSPDGELYREAEFYANLISELEPIPLCFKEYETNKDFAAFILTHEHSWISATARLNNPVFDPGYAGIIMLEAKADIKKGSSGAPIVNLDGELLGIVSQEKKIGKHARAVKALPVWIINQIMKVQNP